MYEYVIQTLFLGNNIFNLVPIIWLYALNVNFIIIIYKWI